ncbi:metal-dependent hydrolase [Peribacillus saganii]|uniref:Metal-dependent hydrolase n=1 Tax=Peribacillus saganii TaxID=2303992 RepID=A0A372LS19_9BACI|nr:metal-dependent hydrolase [Peribacillus saganii]RFU70983.1 metal-dependent hydrolase [Peribacillus saganii]
MDTITHTLFGAALYGSLDKQNFSKSQKQAFFITAIGASQIPDIDVVSQLWDTEGQYQMWHRGITHSIFLAPFWALLFFLIIWALFRYKDRKIFWLALIGVAIHNTSDLFNAWGTGFLEPFLNTRITFGTISIIDFVFWTIIGIAFFASRKNPGKAPHNYRLAWVFMIVHVTLQSIQGYFLYEQYKTENNQVALSASFIPWHFQIIDKTDSQVHIYSDNIFMKPKLEYSLESKEDADLEELFAKRPEARTLYEWSPFVVVVDDEKQLGIYDPRFYRNGQSFLFEYIKKN